MRIPLLLLLALAGCVPARTMATTVASIGANDNRVAAGTTRGDALTVRLEITEGTWQPDRNLAPISILAFAEAGKPATTPGPVIRAQQGTLVTAIVRNRTDHALWIYGLHARPGQAEPLQVAAQATIEARFRADTPGSYYYWGALQPSADSREGGRDSELNGALIVDPPGARSNDRVFMISFHESGKDGPAFWTINGGSWPDTERLDYAVGDTVVWRWINTTTHRHPMHLHGHYFTVTRRGDNWLDRPVAAVEQHKVVTHALDRGSTMTMQWSPASAGHWLFHCHFVFHVMPENRLADATQWYEEMADLPHDQHMAGLVLGINVAPRKGAIAAAETEAARHLTLHVAERGGEPYTLPGLNIPRLGYGLDGGPVMAPGAPLILERGKPVEITVVNEIRHATSVHWHGIELESYYDGVPHFGGDDRRTTPAIAPGESFTARFLPPRAGTFIYHTHFNDFVQLAGGLYGALIVTEAGAPFDAATDHAYVVSLDGGDDMRDPVLLNGRSTAPDETWQVGQRHRLRLINIAPTALARIRLTRDDAPVSWRALAKDGADLPPALATLRRAEIELFSGETYDFEVAADTPGVLQLQASVEDDTGPRASASIKVEP